MVIVDSNKFEIGVNKFDSLAKVVVMDDGNIQVVESSKDEQEVHRENKLRRKFAEENIDYQKALTNSVISTQDPRKGDLDQVERADTTTDLPDVRPSEKTGMQDFTVEPPERENKEPDLELKKSGSDDDLDETTEETLVQIQPYVPTKRVSSLTYKNNEVPGKLLLKPEYFKQMKDDYKLSSSIVHEEELIVLDNDRRVSPGNKFSFVTDENGRPLLAGGALKSDFPNQRKEVEFHGAEGKNTVNLAITVQNYVLSKGYPANSYVVVEVVPKRPPVFR